MQSLSIVVSGRRSRSQRGASEVAQFIPALYVVFVVMLVPLLNLAFLFLSAATLYLATNDFVARASSQQTFDSALNTMASEAFHFQQSGLAKFVSMLPQNGYIGCGDDLYVVSTNVATGAVIISNPDMPLTKAIDTGSNVYEMQVRSAYSVAPLISLSALPILGEVPGLGKPVTLSFVSNRPVEHPGGLQATVANGITGTPTVPVFSRKNLSPVVAADNGTWNNPTIFNQIQTAGQAVVTVNVLVVPANFGPTVGAVNGGWVPTGIVVAPGQKVWIDTQAVGTWGYVSPTESAAGVLNGSTNIGSNIDLDLPNRMLVGYVGTAPILPYGRTSGAISGDPHFIPSGVSLLNFPINYAGPISLACNDCQLNDVGSQKVRIIITR